MRKLKWFEAPKDQRLRNRKPICEIHEEISVQSFLWRFTQGTKVLLSVTAASTLRSQRVPFKIEFRKLNFLILLHYGDFWTRFSRQVNLYMKIISRSNKGGIPHHIIEYHIEEFHIKDINFLRSKITRDLWKLWVILKKKAPSDINEEIKD